MLLTILKVKRRLFILIIIRHELQTVTDLHRYFINVDFHLGDQSNRLEDLRGRIVVYSIIGCPHCLAAKQSLREAHLPFVDVSIDRFPERFVIFEN